MITFSTTCEHVNPLALPELNYPIPRPGSVTRHQKAVIVRDDDRGPIVTSNSIRSLEATRSALHHITPYLVLFSPFLCFGLLLGKNDDSSD